MILLNTCSYQHQERLDGDGKMDKVLITGGTGFIGSHLAKFLKDKGFWVRVVDIKPYEWGELVCDEFIQGDLRKPGVAMAACENIKGNFGQAVSRIYLRGPDLFFIFVSVNIG